MIRAYAVAQVRAAERQVMAGLPEGELMARAAEGLAAAVAERAAARDARRLVVLAGPGANGGDALWAAGLLADRLAVVAIGVAEELHEQGERTAHQAGVVVHRVAPDATTLPAEVVEVLAEADVVVDGMLGIGGRPGLAGAMALLARAVADDCLVIAVDLPSGADPEGLEPLGESVTADETVTFGTAKPVHLLPATEPAVGRLTVVDIGLLTALGTDGPVVERLEDGDVARLWPVPGRVDDKYSRGVLGVVTGSGRYPGAAVLCCTAAVSAGAGMVRYVGPEEARRQVLTACPEVVPGEGRVQAWVLGSGLDAEDGSAAGRAQRAAATHALESGLPCLVDAGGLELVTGPRSTPTLLTPHAGELARLLGRLSGREVSREEVNARPVQSARRAVELTGAAVLLKGATTMVVDADGEVRSQAEAPPWTATAGSGDVLAGLAGTLLAAGLSPLDAGSLAALVHGRAAASASAGGPVRALAIAHAIPATVAQLLNEAVAATGGGSLSRG